MAKNKDYQIRLDKVRNEMIKGVSRYEILSKLEKGEYDWYPDSAEHRRDVLNSLIAEAADTCKFESMAARDEQKALHLERYLDLYRTCLSSNDRSTARAILADIAKLMGLNEKETLAIEHTSYKVKLQ